MSHYVQKQDGEYSYTTKSTQLGLISTVTHDGVRNGIQPKLLLCSRKSHFLNMGKLKHLDVKKHNIKGIFVTETTQQNLK